MLFHLKVLYHGWIFALIGALGAAIFGLFPAGQTVLNKVSVRVPAVFNIGL